MKPCCCDGLLKISLPSRTTRKPLSPRLADALRVIDEYRTGIQPLFAPLMLLHHLLARYDLSEWLASQVYFEPYPRPLVRQS